MSDDGAIDPAATPSGTGCLECEATGSWWFHLRRCAALRTRRLLRRLPDRHATRHFTETGHPIEQSFEPGEDWFWNFRTRQEVAGPRLADPQSHPEEQTVPGPASRVPSDWQQQLGG